MNRLLVFFALFLLAGVSFADSARIEFSDGWIKQLPPVVPMRAAYLRIENRSKQNHSITGIQSQIFKLVEIHETRMVNDVMRMVALDKVDLPAGVVTELKPGGKHLMLMEPQRPLIIGDLIDITISFADGSSRQTQLEIRK